MYYNDLKEETKLFLNKAMDIYATIKDKKIVIYSRLIFDNHEFSKLDKIVLALFIAGFLVEGELKDTLSQFHDLKLNDLFEFINIKEKDIISLSKTEYENFFKENLSLDLANIINKSVYKNSIKQITPIDLILILQYPGYSSILNFFACKYLPNLRDISYAFYNHPLFKSLKMKKGISSPSFNYRSQKNIIPKDPIATFFEPNFETKKPSPTVASKSLDFNDKNIWLLLEDIQKKFIGQEETAENLFYNIINNQQLAEMDDLPDGQRAIIFLDGPTGTGKTAITREITKKLDIPFTATSIINYSSTGYVGGDITDTLKDLYQRANGDLKKAERGIIVLDEFDKLTSRGRELEMKRAVQQQLLDFLGGGKYNIRVGNSIFDLKEVNFDTSKLTFICLGALTDLRSQKTNKNAIGFNQPDSQKEELNYTITPQDLINMGLEKELVGRFNTYLHTNEYSKDDLLKILKESTISPLIGFKMWIEVQGKQLVIDDDVYELIAEQAYELNTGARSLQTIMNNIRTPLIKEVLRGTDHIIHLNREFVERINSDNMNRKGRI